MGESLGGDARTLELRARAGSAVRCAYQVLSRYQRWIPRLNAASENPLFACVFEAHRELFCLAKPLVSADYDHALDVRHWTLRLAPDASFALQCAALFHDMGANLCCVVLANAGVPTVVADQAAALVRDHDKPRAAPGGGYGRQVLADADALSFFALNSPGFVAHFGRQHTLTKVRHTLERMSARALARLARLRLPAEVADAVAIAASAGPVADVRDASLPMTGEA
jgi:hypothetical protein